MNVLHPLAGQPQSLMVLAGEPAMFAVTGVMGGGPGARYTVLVITPAGSTVSRPGVLAVSAGNEMAWR